MADYFDSHCHIHTAGSNRNDSTVEKWHNTGEKDPNALLETAVIAGVTRLICVGTERLDSEEAVDFVKNKDNAWAAVGAHPHEAKKTTINDLRQIRKLIEEDQKLDSSARKIVAVGEVGLDYFYDHSPKEDQIKLLEQFLDMAQNYHLPVIFHVREAFADFWSILNNFRVKGVLHSFTADTEILEKALGQDLLIGLNGIITFTKDDSQLAMAKRVPLDNLLLETDAPYLTPKPFRGKICKPEHVVNTAEFLAVLRGEELEELANKTTKNACRFFNIK